MTGPPWFSAALAALMLLVAAGSVTRLALWRLRGRTAEPEADALHVLMGVAMAGMLEPAVSVVPAAVWRVVFAAAAAWFAWRAVRAHGRQRRRDLRRLSTGWRHGWRCAHPAPHAVESAAMVYMLVPAGSAGNGPEAAMPGMASGVPAANPAVALVLALFMLGYIIWTADRMTSRSRFRARSAEFSPAGAVRHDDVMTIAAAGTALSSRAAACSKIVMSLAMGYMLLTML